MSTEDHSRHTSEVGRRMRCIGVEDTRPTVPTPLSVIGMLSNSEPVESEDLNDRYCPATVQTISLEVSKWRLTQLKTTVAAQLFVNLLGGVLRQTDFFSYKDYDKVRVF
ncbi:hypothetical protein EJB05_17800, partial [Eragrostis curvula]